jgi:hypothetical protein
MKKLLVIFMIFSQSLSASETDNFIDSSALKDSTIWLNQQMNQAIYDSAQNVKNCNKYEVHKNLYKMYGGLFVPKIELLADKNPRKNAMKIEDSIYADVKDVSGEDGLRRLTKFKLYYFPNTAKVNGVVFGGDKLSHFFQTGYSMYFGMKKKSTDKVVDVRTRFHQIAEYVAKNTDYIKNFEYVNSDDFVGKFSNYQEDGQWGMKGTLVKSYADNSANYAGYIFWSNLTEGENPYLVCKNNQFVKVRTFDWRTYVDQSWNESINCSEFHPKIKDKVLAKIDERGMGQCPVLPEECSKLTEKYGELSQYLLHPSCQI